MARPRVSTTSVVVIVSRSVRQDAHVSVSWNPSKLTVARVRITKAAIATEVCRLTARPTAKGRRFSSLLSLSRPLVAVVAVNALGLQRAIGVVSGAYTPIYNPDLGG